MTPLKYLSLRTEQGKRVFSWRGVGAIACSGLFVFSLLSIENLNMYGAGGLIDKVGDFVSTLTGFYVAALVAVSTFGPGRPEMDEKMVSGRLYLGTVDEDDRYDVSRREYLTALFGYLVTLAFSISLGSIVLSVAGGAIVAPTSILGILGYEFTYHEILSYCVALIYFAALFHLVLETSVGLHYLIEKLYRVRPGIKEGSLGKRTEATSEGLRDDLES